MARNFNVEVFSGVINKNITYYSDPKFNELLGSADTLILQVVVDSIGGGDTITAQYETSNDGAPNSGVWQSVSGFAATAIPASAGDVPKSGIDRNASSDSMGAFGRVAVSCGAYNGTAVRVIACGRIDG